MRTPPEVFKSERLVMRRLRLSDAEAIFKEWTQDSLVTRYLHWRPHRSLDDSVAHATRREEDWENGVSFCWILEDGEAGEVLGSIAAHPAGHRVELGYLLKPRAWGRGFMTEAVSELTRRLLEDPGVYRVWAVCDFGNTASVKVLERSGFKFEGTLRRWLDHPNAGSEPRDALCYSVVRS